LIDGVRESAQSWRELLLDLKRRGLAMGPESAVADGALGFWQAVEQVWPQTRGQPCWVRFNQAIWWGELEDLRREAGHMVNAWIALDRAAESAGASNLSREVWEFALSDGSVAAIVPDDSARQCRRASSRGLHARGNRPAAVGASADRENQESLSRGDGDRG
jgi:hypothetical protein